MLYQLSYFRISDDGKEWAVMDSNQLSYSQPHLATLVTALTCSLQCKGTNYF